MYFIGKFIFVCLLYYLITSLVSYVRRKNQEVKLEEFHRKQQEAEMEANKESDNQKPDA